MWYKKYLKYKIKYFNLKNKLIGGNPHDPELCEIDSATLLTKLATINSQRNEASNSFIVSTYVGEYLLDNYSFEENKQSMEFHEQVIYWDKIDKTKKFWTEEMSNLQTILVNNFWFNMKYIHEGLEQNPDKNFYDMFKFNKKRLDCKTDIDGNGQTLLNKCDLLIKKFSKDFMREHKDNPGKMNILDNQLKLFIIQYGKCEIEYCDKNDQENFIIRLSRNKRERTHRRRSRPRSPSNMRSTSLSGSANLGDFEDAFPVNK